jgi:uncharacterized RmlC-like cupin family protein
VATRIPPTHFRRGVGQNADMERGIAISAPTVGSERLYSSVVTTAPGAKTRIHHHGECETSIYILSGRARYTFGATGLEEAFDAEAGDFVYIPAGVPHRPYNPTGSAAKALVARTDPREQESVVLLPALD